MEKYAIIADIGGTNARFATVDDSGEINNINVFKTADFASLEDAYHHYCDSINQEFNPTIAAFAFAGPVINDEIKLLNANWSFSLSKSGDDLGVEYFSIVNDFVAQSMAIPSLEESERIQIGTKGSSLDACPIAVIGAGTGLGVSCLLPDEDDFIAIPTEGGHTTAVGCSEIEKQVIEYLEKKYDHVSFERLVSGQGLENIYNALSFIKQGKESSESSENIFELAKKGDEIASETFKLFFGFLGTVASNHALSYGALGGVYLSGGILTNPDVISWLKDSEFRSRFETKGRLSEYLSDISTFVVTAENIALRGLRNIILEYFENNA